LTATVCPSEHSGKSGGRRNGQACGADADGIVKVTVLVAVLITDTVLSKTLVT
jgi:hypothetical protein